MKVIKTQSNERELRYFLKLVQDDLYEIRDERYHAETEEEKKECRRRETYAKHRETKLIRLLMNMMLDENTFDAESDD